MEQNMFLQELFKIVQHIYQLKSKLNILVALLRMNPRNLMQCQKKILTIQLNQAAIFHQFFVEHHLLQNMNFNGHCLIKNNISIPKKINVLYFLHNNSMFKKFKHRFCIK